MRWAARSQAREQDTDPASSMRLLYEVLDRPLDPGYESAAADREAAGQSRSSGGHSLLTILTVVGLGIAFSVAALTLRAPDPQDAAAREQLAERIEAAGALGDDYAHQVEGLRAQIATLEQQALQGAPEGQSEQLRDIGLSVGAVALSGPGMVFTLDDAPADGGELAPPAQGSSQRVLARDLQFLTNGMWAAGAEAIAINEQRLTSTSSIRFAGEAIVVDFRGMTRPYVVRVIGEPSALEQEAGAGATGSYLQELRSEYRLQVRADTEDVVTVPAAERLSTRVATVAPADRNAEEDQ